jgi:hypothetical protein
MKNVLGRRGTDENLNGSARIGRSRDKKLVGPARRGLDVNMILPYSITLLFPLLSRVQKDVPASVAEHAKSSILNALGYPIRGLPTSSRTMGRIWRGGHRALGRIVLAMSLRSIPLLPTIVVLPLRLLHWMWNNGFRSPRQARCRRPLRPRLLLRESLHQLWGHILRLICPSINFASTRTQFVFLSIPVWGEHHRATIRSDQYKFTLRDPRSPPI